MAFGSDLAFLASFSRLRPSESAVIGDARAPLPSESAPLRNVAASATLWCMGSLVVPGSVTIGTGAGAGALAGRPIPSCRRASSKESWVSESTSGPTFSREEMIKVFGLSMQKPSKTWLRTYKAIC